MVSAADDGEGPGESGAGVCGEKAMGGDERRDRSRRKAPRTIDRWPASVLPGYDAVKHPRHPQFAGANGKTRDSAIASQPPSPAPRTGGRPRRGASAESIFPSEKITKRRSGWRDRGRSGKFSTR